jgi:hypothetical protein
VTREPIETPGDEPDELHDVYFADPRHTYHGKGHWGTIGDADYLDPGWDDDDDTAEKTIPPAA